MKRRKQMKKLLAAFMSALMILGIFMSFSASAESAADSSYVPYALRSRERIPIYVDGSPVLEGSAYLIDGITYVPLRAFCDSFDGAFTVSWNGVSHTASATSGSLTLKAQQDAYYITANERCFYTVGKVLNIEGRIYVPIRPMAKAFCLDLTWNGESRSVSLSSTGKRLSTAAEVYDSEDIYWLSRIINAEAGSEPFLGKIAVGNVVLNRVRSSQYPNTVKGVVFDRKYGVQFSPVSNGTIYNSPNYDSIVAARICLEGYSLSTDVLYFLNPRIATNFWIVNNRRYEFTIGNHKFYS